MYVEDEYSRNLMRLNALHKDIENSEKRRMMLKALYEKFREILFVIESIIHVRKVGVKKVWIMIKTLFCPRLQRDYELEYSFDHTYEIDYRGTGKKISGKIVVYTSIFGGYDTILEPYYVSDMCDYFIITDQKVPEESVWKKITVENVDEFEKMDDYHKSKFCKMMPHILFPEYDYSIWVDGNVQIVADLVPLVDRMEDKTAMATFRNPLHDCIYTEKNFLICKNAANYEQLEAQVNLYRENGFPRHFGMREFSIIVRKHSDKLCQKLMKQWWKHVNEYTMRDQISFPYILWENRMNIDYIQLLGGNWRHNPRFISMQHQWRHTFVK